MVALLVILLWVSCATLIDGTAPTPTPTPNPKTIFILAGQSNMSGRGGITNNTWNGVIPPECRPSPSILRLTAALKWVKATEPLHADIDVNTTCGIGPGMAFANSVLKSEPRIGVVGLVPCAVGGLRGTTIVDWSKGGYLYGQMVKRAEAALMGGGTIGAVLWYQGESDTVSLQSAKLYGRRLKKFFMDLRSDLNSPHLPIIQVRLASGQGAYVETVRKSQVDISRITNVTNVDAKGLLLNSDHLHLTTHAEIELGIMLARAFLRTTPRHH